LHKFIYIYLYKNALQKHYAQKQQHLFVQVTQKQIFYPKIQIYLKHKKCPTNTKSVGIFIISFAKPFPFFVLLNWYIRIILTHSSIIDRLRRVPIFKELIYFFNSCSINNFYHRNCLCKSVFFPASVKVLFNFT